MKKNLKFILCFVLLSLAIHVRSEESTTGTTYFNNSFTAASDTAGWVITGDGLDASSNYNWKWYKYSTKYMKCGKSYKPNTTFTYTLTSPEIILTNRGADLSFRYVKSETGSTFIVYVLHNGLRHILLSNLLPTGSTSTWFNVEASLNAYAGDTVQLVFEHTNIYGYVYLDDVILEESPLCPTAKHLALTSLQNTSASFSWDNTSSDHYTMLLSSVPQLDPSLVAPSEILFQDTITATANGSTTWNYTKSNLIEGTQYYLYLKSDCSALMQGYSTWSKVLSFQTPCSAQPVPYIMDFNALSLGEVPSCWISTSTYETLPGVINPILGDEIDTTKVFDISNNMNSESMIILPLFSADVKGLMMSLDAMSEEENMSFQIGLTNDLTDAQNIVTLFNQDITNEWDTYTFFFDNSFTITGSNYYIVLYMSSGKTESNNAFHVYLDNITVDTAPSCLYPLQVGVTAVLDNACTVAWVDKNTTVIDYTIEYTAEGGTAQTVNTTTSPYTLTGLSQDTRYAIRVRSNCSTTDNSAYSNPRTIHTRKSPILVTTEDAGIENFEGTSHAFTLLGSSTPNIWAVGTALANSPTHSMYISGDYGTSYGTSDASSYSYAYAYANVSIPQAGNYNFSFTWKGLSNSDYNSYMYVFLTTPEKQIELDHSWGTSEEGTTIVGTKFTNTTNEDWENVNYIVNAPAAGMYRIVFFRKTSSSSKYVGNYTAIDDIKIKYIACDTPTEFTQTSTSTSSIGLSWTSSANNFTVKAFTTAIDLDSIETTTELPIATASSTTPSVNVTGLSEASLYYFYVQAHCDATHNSEWIGPLLAVTDCDTVDLPYTYDFNSDIDGTMPLCWMGSDNGTSVTTSPSSYLDIDGTPVLELNGLSLSYVILPGFSTTIANSVLEFDYNNRSSYSSSNIIVGYITNTSDMNTFVGLDTLDLSTSKTHTLITFTEVDASITGRLIITEPAGSSTSTSYGSTIDNINVYEYPSCWPILAFNKQSNTRATEFTVSWEPNTASVSRNFIVEYGLMGFVPGSANGTLVNATDTFCTLTGLTSSTAYDIYVTTDCGDVNGTSTSKMGTFKTLITPADGTNYSCNFEDSTENTLWTIESTTGHNSWEIGTQSSYEGNKGLYIVDSSDELGYDGSSTDHCWAYRNLHCTPGLYTVTLDYQCKGQSNYDYMNCVIIPEAYMPEAGSAEGITISSIPKNWFTGIPIKMNLHTTWISYSYEFIISNETDVTLALHWTNNSSGYYDPASVDNITVNKVNCRPAYDIDLKSLSQTTANLTWISDSYDHFEIILDTITHTSEELDTIVSAFFINRNVTADSINITGLQAANTYYAYVRNNCSDTTQAKWSEVYTFITLCDVYTLPFTDDFETNEDNSVPLCWTSFTGDNVKISSTKSFNSTKSLYLKTADASAIKIALPVVNMPLAIENYQLVFYAYRTPTSNEADIVLALNSAEDVSSTELNSIRQETITIPASQEGMWKRIVVPFEHPTDILTGQPIVMGNEQIVFITIPGPADLYIDAVTIEEIPACSEPYDMAIDSILAREIYYSWNGLATNYEIQCISADETDTITRIISGDTAIFSGLMPHTAYNIHVRSLCNTSETSVWSQFIGFTTECAIENLPYLEDFSSIVTGEMPVCWDVVDGGNYDNWTSLNNGPDAYMYLSIGCHYAYDFTLTTPEIDLSTATHGTMFFDIKGIRCEYTPTSLYVLDKTTGLTDTLMSNILFTTDWTNFGIDIQPYVGHVVRFQFMIQTIRYKGGDIYLDNIGVEDRLYVAVPEGLTVSNPTTNSVVVHVNTDPIATSHNVAVIPENSTFDPLTAIITPMTLTDSVIVTGLLSNTYYKVYAQAMNGSFGSKWIGAAHFNTSCAAQSLPLIEDFETSVNGVATLPLCWTIEGNVTTSQLHPTSGEGSIKVASSGTFISSEITDELNTAEVYFNGYATSGTPIIVSVCTDPLDMTTKMVVDTVTVLNDNSKILNVDFTAVPSGYHYVVFENKGTNAAYLDNIVIRTYATCRFPETFTLGLIEKGKVNILITDSVDSNYDIYCGLSTDVDLHKLTATVSNVSDSAWITGLGSNMLYSVFVRKNCGTSMGQWIGPLDFTSACKAITITDDSPYVTDFSTLTASTYNLPACFSSINNTSSSTLPYAKQFYYYSSSSPDACIQAESGLEDSLYIVLPEFSNALNTLRFKFSIKPEQGSSYSISDCCLNIGSLYNPCDESTFTPIKSLNLEGLSTSSYSDLNIDLRYADIPDSIHYLAYRMSDSDHYIKIKDIELSIIDGCDAPRLNLDNVEGTSATININPIASATRVDLVISNESGSFTDTIWGLDVSTESYTFTGLTLCNIYNVIGRSYSNNTLGGEDMSAWSEPTSFIIPFEAVTTYPYYCNFEDSTENSKWLHPNGGLTNQWIIGSDPDGISEGTKGLYISEDNSTASYDIRQYTFTWASRQLHMLPGSYKISFMAKVGGYYTTDFLRCFIMDSKSQILPCNYNISTLDDFDFKSITATSDHAGFIDLLEEENYLSAKDWTLYTYHVIVTDTVNKQLGFLWKSTSSSGAQPGACIDSISITYDDCPAPLSVDFIKLKSSYIKISSKDELENDTVHLHYACVLRDSTFNATNTVATATAISGDTVTLRGLTETTLYDLYTARTCLDGSTGAWSEPMPFKTAATPGSMPYFCGFEPSEAESTAWKFYNDDTNAWIVDTMTPLTDDYSMYISDDNSTASYDNSETQYSYAARTIHFEPGTYDFSFSWKCQGESEDDYIMVALTPDTFIPEGGSSYINGIPMSYNMATPEGSMLWGKLNLKSSIQTETSIFSIMSACDMTLVFAWKNNGNDGSNPSAMIDDITITKQFCAIPINIRTESLTSTSVKLAWTSSAISTHLTFSEWGVQTPIADTTVTDTFFVINGLTASTGYSCQMFSICSAVDSSSVSEFLSFSTPYATYTLPFEEDFEEDLSIPIYWQETKGIATLDGITYGSDLSGTNSIWDHTTFPSSHQKMSVWSSTRKDWLITPLIALDNDATLSFDLALTDCGNWNTPDDETGIDDKFAVMISRDNGITWQSLSTWESTSDNGHKYYDISNTYETQMMTIPCHADHAPIQIAFYGESTEKNAVNDIHLDNIRMNCLSNDTLVIYDTICQGYAYNRYGFDFPENSVTSGTFAKLVTGDASTCDQMKELHLMVNPSYDLVENATICQGQSYPFGTANLTIGGDYLNTLSTVNGCDSIVHLNLTVTQLVVNIDTMICEGDYIEFNGEQITTSGVYSDTTRNAEGCDSVTNIILNVLPASSTMDTTICEGDAVTVGSTVYTTQGLYIDTLKNVLDCDSTVTLNLIVIPSDSVYADQFCANSTYNFRGTILRTPGVYTDTIYDYLSSGCDYVYTLTLSETMPDTVEIADQFCEGMTSFYEHGFSIDDPEEKDYIVTKTSGVTGCDSVTILHLSMVNTVYGSIAQTICDNESYTFGGKDYYAEGTYEHTFASMVTGCDSIVTLTLTVNPTYTVDVNDSIDVKQLPYTNLTLVVPVGTEVGTYDYTIESATQAGCDSIINLTLNITQNIGLDYINVGTLDFYPNVVKGGGNVTITTDFSESERQELSIHLYDATGKLIATYQPQSTGTMSYTMPSVSGMYYLRLETKSGKAFSGKLIIL